MLEYWNVGILECWNVGILGLLRKKVYKSLQQQVILRGQSQSTLNNYIRRIALISLHFGQLPEHISDDELTEYLTSLALDKKSPSRSSFKHMVYGLCYYFRLTGDNKRAVSLSSLRKEAKSQFSSAYSLHCPGNWS